MIPKASLKPNDPYIDPLSIDQPNTINPNNKRIDPHKILKSLGVESSIPLFNVFSTQEIYSLSLSDDNQPTNKSSAKPKAKAQKESPSSYQLEHVLVDNLSGGYAERGLAYEPGKQLLATCSSNGHVLIWTIGEYVECVAEWNIDEMIYCAKFAEIGKRGPHLFIAAKGNVYVYDMGKNAVELQAVLHCGFEVDDFEVNTTEEKIIVAGGSEVLLLWNLKDFRFEKTVGGSFLSSPIRSLIYLPEKDHLFVERDDGLSQITGSFKGPSGIFSVKTGINVLGLSYIKSKQLLVQYKDRLEFRNPNDLGLKSTSKDSSAFLRTMPTKIFYNEDFSQKNGGEISLDPETGCVKLPPKEWAPKKSAVEIIADQQRIVVGDLVAGVLFIYRAKIGDAKSKKSLRTAVYKRYFPAQIPELNMSPNELNKYRTDIDNRKGERIIGEVEEKNQKKNVFSFELSGEKDEKVWVYVPEEMKSQGRGRPSGKDLAIKEVKEKEKGKGTGRGRKVSISEEKKGEKRGRKKKNDDERSRSRSKSKTPQRGRGAKKTGPK